MQRRIPAAFLIALLIAGCGVFGGGRRELAEQRQAAWDAAQRAIEQRLRREPGVTEVDVSYTKDFSTFGAVGVDIAVETRMMDDPERLLDLEERAVWQSTLAPLTGMDLTARDAADPTRVHGRLVSITPEERARLDSRYGPRPVAPTKSD